MKKIVLSACCMLFLFKAKPFFAEDNIYEILDSPKLTINQLVKTNFGLSQELAVLQLYQCDETFFSEIVTEVLDIIENNRTSPDQCIKNLQYGSAPTGAINHYSLLDWNGDFHSIKHHSRSIKDKRFVHKEKYPNLNKLLSFFPHSLNFRITEVHGKSSYGQHRNDICMISSVTNKPALRVRFHLPIITNEKALIFMEGNLYHFEPGKIYFFHNGCVHDALNLDSSKHRIHLLWDMLLTEDTYERMFKRSITCPELEKLENLRPKIVGKVDILPNHKCLRTAIPFETAIQSVLCPIQ